MKYPLRLGTGTLPRRRPLLVAADLDGTLLPLNGEPTAEMTAALAALTAAGVQVVVSTGRMFRSARSATARLGISAGAIVCYQGAVVADLASGRRLLERPLSPTTAAAVVRRARELGRHVNAYVHDELHVEELDEWARLYVARAGVECIVDADLELTVLATPPDKLLLMSAADDAAALEPRLRERWPDVTIAISQPGYIEITAAAATKRGALEYLCERWGLGPDRAVACGDGMNDVDMLEWAAFGVAMAEGPGRVWEAADLVLPQAELADLLVSLSRLPA